MKKLFFIFCILLVSELIYSCASISSKNKEIVFNQTNDSEIIIKTLQNHSFLSEENIGQTFNISGILQKNDTSFYILENSDSKSMVSFLI